MQFRKYSLRFIFVFIFLLTCLISFAVKLILIQVFNSDHLTRLADKQHNYLLELEPIRGTIYDRNRRPLAVNVSVQSLYANPKIMNKSNKLKAIEQLPIILGKDKAMIEDRLNRDKYFVWLDRKIDNDTVEKILELKIQGLNFIDESKRYYPNNELAAHIIGFAGVDNHGLEGIELLYNDILKGEQGKTSIIRDARQRDLLLQKDFIAAKEGQHIILTIDETIQYIAEQSLDEAFRKHNAKAASIIVIDVKTGEILALANRPTYNLSDVKASSIESRTNRAVSFVYEPGSVFKIVAASAALEEEVFVENDRIFCENGQYRVGNHILHDHTSHGNLSFQEVFELSSNIGTTKVAQKVGPDLIYKYIKRFHFGERTNIDLLGEVSGGIKAPKYWSKTSIGAIPIGQEVTVTPLQLVYALGAIANNGLYMKPLLVKSIEDNFGEVIKFFEPQVVDRVISQDTAKRVTDILVGVVEKGTAPKAKIDGVKVAGKTGTAQKVVNNTYSHSDFYATFMGFAPADNPKLAAIVVFDEPKPQHFGGTVAAPVFKEVIEKSLRYLNY